MLIAVGVPNYLSYSVLSKQATAKEMMEHIQIRMGCSTFSPCMTLEEAAEIVIAAERDSEKTRYYDYSLNDGGLLLFGNIDDDIANDVWWLTLDERVVHKMNDIEN